MSIQSSLLVLIVLVGVWFFYSKASDLDPLLAKKMVHDGAILLDVRTPAEFEAKHIEGAINIPISELEQRHEELGDNGKVIIVYCASGIRSARAKKLLKLKGFGHTHNLGGISRWLPDIKN